MSLPRIISQVVILGSQIVGKAFVEAYKQAARNARSGASSSSAGGASASAAMSGSIITRRHRMTVDEAAQILNLKPVRFLAGPQDPLVAAELEEMLKAYERMYKANEETSRYLLSKIVRAKDRIEAEVLVGRAAEEAEAAAGKAAEGQGPTTGAGTPPPSG